MDFKQLVNSSIGIALSLAIGGCAEPSNTALKNAHQEFAHQNYGEAFGRLQKAVKYHDRRVEYALGYCYYYGLGTAPDPYYARYYISRSAWQLYKPAVAAMNMFYQPLPTFADIGRKASTPAALRLRPVGYARHNLVQRRLKSKKSRSVHSGRRAKPRPQHQSKSHKSHKSSKASKAVNSPDPGQAKLNSVFDRSNVKKLADLPAPKSVKHYRSSPYVKPKSSATLLPSPRSTRNSGKN